MKILVLMPMDEQHVYAAAGIYKALSHEVKAVTFAIPTFMDYLINGKIVENWVMAMCDGLLSAKKLYEAAVKNNDNLIIIGNAPKDYQFDAIFNFQEIDESLPYEDKFLDKVRELLGSDETIEKIVSINNLHSADESELSLHNCIATADFLSAYMQTEPQLNEIKEKYKKKIFEFDKIDKIIDEEIKDAKR